MCIPTLVNLGVARALRYSEGRGDRVLQRWPATGGARRCVRRPHAPQHLSPSARGPGPAVGELPQLPAIAVVRGLHDPHCIAARAQLQGLRGSECTSVSYTHLTLPTNRE